MLDRPVCLNGCVGTVGAGCVGWYSRYWMSVTLSVGWLGICWLFGCWFKVWSVVLYLILKYVNVWPKDKINWPKIKLTGPKIKLTGPKIKLTGPKIKLTGPKMYTVNGIDH